MTKQKTVLLALASIFFLVNGDWGNKDVSEEKGRWQRQPINVSGQLTTLSGDTYPVENISLNRQIKQIKLFALPSAKLFSVSTDKPSVRTLSKEPAKYLDTTNIDLVEVKKLETPYPDVTWIYEEEPGKGRKLEFMQIDITLVDGSKTSYLASSRMMLYCDRKTYAAGPQEKDVPLAAIKDLSITGYAKRDDNKTEEATAKAAPIAATCPPCETEPATPKTVPAK